MRYKQKYIKTVNLIKKLFLCNYILIKLSFRTKIQIFFPFTPTKYILQPVYFLVISPEKFKDLILLLVENIKYTVPIFANSN